MAHQKVGQVLFGTSRPPDGPCCPVPLGGPLRRLGFPRTGFAPGCAILAPANCLRPWRSWGRAGRVVNMPASEDGVGGRQWPHDTFLPIQKQTSRFRCGPRARLRTFCLSRSRKLGHRSVLRFSAFGPMPGGTSWKSNPQSVRWTTLKHRARSSAGIRR